jgi:Lsr2
MAQRTRIELVDDTDGKVLRDGEGETVSFALDGTTYEIDLSTRNADKFRSLFQDYIAAGRRVGAGRTQRGVSSSTSTRDYDPQAVRKWAASNKVNVPARGRIPREVLERFKAEGN